MHAAANAPRGLVDGGHDSGVLKRERRVQPGNAAADDGYPSLVALVDGRPCRHRPCESGSAGRRARGLEEVASREPHLPALLLDRLDGTAGPLGLVKNVEEILEPCQQRGTDRKSV